MRKLIVALAMTTAVCLASAAVAFADGAPPTQGVSQSAGTSQIAGAASSAVQVQPTNTNISVRIFSPGNDGNVTQTNSASSTANAGNAAGTSQSADQSQSGSGVQGAEQTASTDQAAIALSEAKQFGASNVNTPVRILSPGDGGDVTQSNTADSNAAAGNKAWTGQRNMQGQGSSCGCASGTPTTVAPPSSAPSSYGTTSDGPSSAGQASGGNGGTQGAIQSADTQQAAGAASKAVQIDPSNSNISVRIFSPGNDGDVTQTNSVDSTANAGNHASTEQRASQSQTGDCGCHQAPPPKPSPCGCGSAPNQSVQPDATSDPSAQLTSDPSQGYQPESNQPADSAAAPASSPAVGVQGAGQEASTSQLALAGSAAVQKGASNTSDPVRIGSWGSGGDVTQTNSVSSAANAGNDAKTHQDADQSQGGSSSCGCGGEKVQGAGQKAETDQGSLALSKAIQDFGHESPCGCGSEGGSGNDASPVRVGSPGTDGNVTQSNSVDSTANAGNRADTSQDATQSSGGGGGMQVQGVGQLATTLQGAFAGSLAVQKGASNDASPVRLFSPGGGGDVNQSNSATSEADSGNDASTDQRSDQEIGGKKQCGCTGRPIQAVGQQAWTGQLGLAGSAAFQDDPQNVADPVRFKSPDGYENPKQPCGCKGSDEPKAYPDGGSCGCQGSPDGGSYGQQGSADGGSYGTQSSPDWGSYGGSNLNSGSPYGGSDTQPAYPDTQKMYPKGGSTDQSNTAGSTANGGNEGRTHQSASQLS